MLRGMCPTSQYSIIFDILFDNATKQFFSLDAVRFSKTIIFGTVITQSNASRDNHHTALDWEKRGLIKSCSKKC